MVLPPRWCLALVILAGMSVASFVNAQNFGHDPNRDVRLDWKLTEGYKGPKVAGYLYNLRDDYVASHVHLQVEALDSTGNVVATSSAYLSGEVPPARRAYFQVQVPISKAASYRVMVRTLTWRGCGAGGGGA
jgi:hypothetical protein